MSFQAARWVIQAVVVAASLIAGGVSRAAQPPAKSGWADLVVIGERILTLDHRRPRVRALAARNGRIAALGSEAQVRPWIGPTTRVITLAAGALAVPGFIEGHGHFVNLGYAKRRLDFMNVRSWDEVVSMVAARARQAEPGEWILGRGWHQEKWDRVLEPNVEGFPTHAALSRAAPLNPVHLTHASGHASIANAAAMKRAEVTKETRDPPGGEILRDESGAPIGVFRENAARLIGEALSRDLAARTPEQIEADLRSAIELASGECLAKGITSFQDAGSSFATIDAFRKLADEGKLPVRLWVMVREGPASLARELSRYRIEGREDERLTVRAIKVTFDGALGSRGAWLLEPYADLPGHVGLNTTPIDTLRAVARIAVQNDVQLCVHAIGDRANRVTLDVFEEALRADPARTDHRWRVEHAQHLSASDIPRFARLGVIASMQGIHCTSDAPWVHARLGERRAAEGAYAWRKLMRSGAVIVNGTDTPVEDVSPIACYYASVTRRLADGRTFYPGQRMNRLEALRSYTWNAAYAAFEEDRKGSLAPGKLADITILSQDITTVPEERIPFTEVLYTIVGGKVAYRNPALP